MMRTAARLGILAALALAGCSSTPKPPPDPLIEVKNPRLSPERRARAIDGAWERVERGDADRAEVREDLKTLVWSVSWPTELRHKALGTVLGDTDPEGTADSRQLVRLMLPREQKIEIISLLAATAAERGWTDTIPALVRSLSRYDPSTPDEDRPEYRAIARLAPHQPVARTVLDTFINPPPEEGIYGVSTVERTRADAWNVLGRLDPNASLRLSILEGESTDPDILSIRAAITHLRAAPRSGEEFAWLRSLRDPTSRANAQWWAQAAEAVAAMGPERSPTLHLRHAEIIRWAAQYRPNWARASRQELLSELRQRLVGRSIHQRTAKEAVGDRAQLQTLEAAETVLQWPDILTVLVLDEAVRDPAVIDALFAQADLDRDDRSAEYGGIVEAMPGASGDGAMRVVMFPPRPGSRRGDREFVASSDMMQQGDRSMAHYHFHVQEVRNSKYAGPSAADLDYADRLGRNCLVFTSVGKGALNVDYYQPGGIILDLGELQRR